MSRDLREGRVMKPQLYYGWVVVAVTFCTIMVAGGIRASPPLFIRSFQREFGWDTTVVALAVSISLLVYGAISPVAGRLLDAYGPRWVVSAGLLVLLAGVGGTLWVETPWQLYLLWGLAMGVGTGVAAGVVSATIATRWFTRRRGLVTGILGSATSAGQPGLPLLMALILAGGWRAGVVAMVIALAVVLTLVVLSMRDAPSAARAAAVPAGAAQARSLPPPVAPIRSTDFWVLSGAMFVCGATANGLVGTHLLPHSIDHGFSEVSAAGALGVMGLLNFVGTAASGWLSDRYDKRKLLAAVFALRGLSLFFLPFVSELHHLTLFVMVYGLDWFATLPPTVGLIADRFGRRSVGTTLGWIFLSHQVGAALAAYLAGASRIWLGDYGLAFTAAGAMAVFAAGLSLKLSKPVAVPAPASV